MSNRPNNPGPISEIHQEYGAYGPYVITKSGSLIGAIELAGRDPDGLVPWDFRALSLIARDVYQALPAEITITHYYAHFNNAELTFRDRSHPVCDLLSKRRADFLKEKGLSNASVVHYFELRPSESLTKLDPVNLFKHLGLSVFNANSREIIKQHFSNDQSIVCYVEELEKQKRVLDQSIDTVIAKWSSLAFARKMNLIDVWAHMRFLSNLDASLLTHSRAEAIPDEDWDLVLSDGDRQPVTYQHMDTLKFHGTPNRYARIAAVTQFGGGTVMPGTWAQEQGSPVRLNDNFIIMARFKALSKIQAAMMFKRSRDELERRGMSMGAMMSGDSKSEVEKLATMKPIIAERMRELQEAEMIEDRWGMAHAFVLTYDTDATALRESGDRIRKSLGNAGLQACWETADLPDAYRTFLPGGGENSMRDIPFTTSQFGATALIYKASEGQVIVPDLDHEEAQYVFQSEDGTPFHYNPFVGGRGMVFGVGPIRSGKSFTKNTLATHFMKYGGLFRAIDIDPGSEPVAQCFGDDGSIFRIEGDHSRGLNPFAVAEGERDMAFVAHLKNLIMQMLKANDSESLRHLEPHEQRDLDDAILATLRLPKHLQRLSSVANHCPKELAQKIQRWVDDGLYAHYFDQPKDAMRGLDHPVAVFNLAGVKDDPTVLPLVMTEIFYRITRAYENPEYRLLPKFLDIDEAHALLKIPYIAQYIVRSVRTWGKWRAGIGLWTQSPKEFIDLPDWAALRSAASTFFFMADPQLDRDLYQAAFGLTPGECEAIKNLIPKREAYIVQPDYGISKKVIF